MDETAAHPSAAEMSAAHPIRWGVLWLCNVLIAIPLAIYLYAVAEGMYPVKWSLPAWALG